MPERNSIAAYRDAPNNRVRQWLLTIAAQLGELTEHITIVGGLVPSLLIDAEAQQIEPHVGTFDVDLGVAVAVHGPSHYQAMTVRLAELGFRQLSANSIRWTQASPSELPIDIDLLPVGLGTEQQVIPDLRAKITLPLELAFRDRVSVRLQGPDIVGQNVAVSVGVCGPGAFIAIKANTYDDRHLKKDAYDLYYMLHHYGHSTQDVIRHFRPLLQHPQAKRAFKVLSDDFSFDDAEGCRDVALFL
ncbi:MAG TPA: hypothetical protein VL096_16245, partial [Pirellulaceae bacterium]|nr:hypothetical protein [Pirellulaceae bacterium]